MIRKPRKPAKPGKDARRNSKVTPRNAGDKGDPESKVKERRSFAQKRPKPQKGPVRPEVPPRLRYLLFHKPYAVLSQFTPEGGKACLKDFINVPGIYACGRLDWDSEGLLLLTNDGDFNHSVAAPGSKLPKTYWVQVEGTPDAAALESLRKGVLIEGRATLPARAERFPAGDALLPRSVPIRERKNIPAPWLRLTLIEGRNRQVRKMTAAVGHPTLRLIRHSIGPFTLEGLEPGRWRELSAEEIRSKMSTFPLRPRT